MDTTDLARILKQKAKEVDALIRRRLPVIVGRMAKDHFQDNFRRSGVVNGGLHPWQPTARDGSPDESAAAQYGPLLHVNYHI